MAPDLWTQVDGYIEDRLLGSDPVLHHASEATLDGGLPAIAVSPAQGRFLGQLVTLRGASRILEIGTLGGYSAICMARALPLDGRLITLEIDEHHANVARANLEHAGLADKVEVIVGPAIETLPTLKKGFDLVFIDADKQSGADYFAWAVKLANPGCLIVVDNVIRDGKVIDEKSDDPMIVGTRRLFEAVAKERKVTATALQTVGSKGYDGLLLAVVQGK
jgi:predicted O-methyltransferase YrrM